MNRILGDVVLAVHAAWILAVVFGPLWCWRRPRWRVVHLTLMGLTLFSGFVLGVCPLTHLENWFWRGSNPETAYPGGFIAHYAWKVVYWEVPQILLSTATLAWFCLLAGIYAFLWRRERGRNPNPKMVK